MKPSGEHVDGDLAIDSVNTPIIQEEGRPGGAWKLRFWTFFTGQGMSLLGSSVTQFVLIWWVTDNTGDISSLGVAGLAALLPQALLGPLAGVFADRYSRQAIMLCTDIVNAGCAFVLVWLFQDRAVELWHIFALMAVRSAMQAFQFPASTASVAMLVPKYFVTTAAGLSQSIQGVMIIAAAPIGAVVLASMPIEWALSIDVFTASLGCLPLLFFEIPQRKQITSKNDGFWSQFKEGVSVVWDDRGLRSLFGLMILTLVILMPLFTLVPMLVKVHFEGGAPQVAILESMAGVGMIIGGGVVAVASPVKKVPWILGGIMGACLFISLTAAIPGENFLAACVFWMLASSCSIASNGAFMALLQVGIPNQLQGRVISLLATLIGMASPFGLMLATPLGSFLGTRGLFVVLGSLGAAIILLGFFSSSIRSMDRLGGVSPDLAHS